MIIYEGWIQSSGLTDFVLESSSGHWKNACNVVYECTYIWRNRMVSNQLYSMYLLTWNKYLSIYLSNMPRCHFVRRSQNTHVGLWPTICILDSDVCTFCKNKKETLAHSFYECLMSKQLWVKLIKWLSPQLQIQSEIDMLLLYKRYICAERCKKTTNTALTLSL